MTNLYHTALSMILCDSSGGLERHRLAYERVKCKVLDLFELQQLHRRRASDVAAFA